jgi:alpha-1,3-mannosyltransferase
MRILQVTRVFHPHLGGIEKHVEWLSRALLARGHHVEVLTLDRSFADGTRFPPTDTLDADTRPLRVTRVPFAGSTRYPLAPGILPHLRGHDGLRWDVIHVHALDFLADAAVASRPWHRTPVVLSTHGGFFHTDFARRLKQAWFQTATRALVHAVDALVFTSDQDEALFRPLTRRGTLLRSAVELGPWRTLEPAPEPGRFVTTGRLDVHKGLSNLVRTLRALRDADPRPFQAHLVGPEVAEGLVAGLRREADALGIGERVHLHGRLSFDAMREQVRCAELGLFPSTYESFGLSVVEAMSAGVVPVLNDIAAFRYFVREGENGFVTDYAQPERAAAVLRRAMDLGEGRGAVVRAARASAEAYGWERAVEYVERVYAALV